MTHACRYSEFLLSLGTSTLDITCYTYEINGYYVADYLSFGINCTLICVSVYFSFVSFPRRCNACTIWIYIYISKGSRAPYFAFNISCICVSNLRTQRMHSRIDRSRKTSLRFQYRTSPVDVTRAYACLLTSLESCLQHLPPFPIRKY